MIPIVGTTNLGIPFFKWTQQFICGLAQKGIYDAWAFTLPNDARAKASDYRNNIFSKLELIQATATLIDPDCNVCTAFGMQRSGRRFFTTQTIIMSVSLIISPNSRLDGLPIVPMEIVQYNEQ